VKADKKLTRLMRNALAVATALSAVPALAQEAPQVASTASSPSLEQQFQDPPNSARPRVWWHWMNGNITKDGIAKDMAWMKRVGIGGLQNFDADISTPQIVDKRLVYMTPEWKDAFRFAATEADRLGLELAIAASPGWSETGGPWVKPEDGLKKVVWSETLVEGGKRFTGTLAAPPSVTGPFQSMKHHEMINLGSGNPNPTPDFYRDIAVLAVPVGADGNAELATPKVSDASGATLDPAKLFDDNLESGLTIPVGPNGTPGAVVLRYDQPQTIRAASLFIANAKNIFGGASVAPRLEASDDGQNWRKVAEFEVSPVPSTVGFAPVTARNFRVVLEPVQPEKVRHEVPPGLAMGNPYAALTAAGQGPKQVNDLRLSSEAKVDQFELKAGFGLVPDYYTLGNRGDTTAGVDPAKVIDLTSRLKPDGTLDWTPPKGKWRVLRLGSSLLGTTNHPAPKEATGLEVDKFDGAAVRRYLDHYIGMYRDAAGADLVGQHGVRALLTDSIEVGAANWTPRMVEQFKALRGYDPTPWLPTLAGVLVGSRAESDRFLYDYRRTLADLMASEHYGTVAKVAHENSLKVYGEALEDHRPSLGDDMAMRSHTDVPMAALWTYGRDDGPIATYLADMKGASSVAHLYGQNLAAAESMTAAMNPWAFAPSGLRRIIDLEFVSGINRPVIHTSVHQPRDDKFPGLSLFIFGQYFNRHESWAEMARPWVDYMARNALMLQQGRNVADVGYFYGEEAPLTGLFGDKPVADAPKTSAYDFVNADALMTLLRNDGADLVAPSGARYRALYLGGSSSRMTLATLRKIAALAEGGATVVGLAPTSNPSLADDPKEYAALVKHLWAGGEETRVGQGRVIAGKDVEAALRRIGVTPDFAYSGGQEGADIPFVHRQLADGDSYFLVNRRNLPEVIEARFRVTGKAPELWHADTGKAEPVSYRVENGETVVPLSLDAEESVHVVFRKPAPADSLAIKKLVPVERASITGPWKVSFQQERGAPTSAVLPSLAPLNENADPGIKYFSGEATYAKEFATPGNWKQGQPLWLDLGKVGELAEVTINGKVVGTAWHAPFRIDISRAAKPGKNRLEVTVANLWVNRLVGDAQPGAQKVTWTSMPTYSKDAPLRPSGLIGPVTLMGQ
jgi:hypothetical protein